MRRLTFALLLALALMVPRLAEAQTGYAMKFCSKESENTGPGSCRYVRFLPGNSAGMGTLSLVPVGAALYAYDAATNRALKVAIGAGTSGAALRVVLASDGPGGSASTPTYVDVRQLGGSAITTAAGAVAAGTQRMTLASDDPAVASLAVVDDWDRNDVAATVPGGTPNVNQDNCVASNTSITDSGVTGPAWIKMTCSGAASSDGIDMAATLTATAGGVKGGTCNEGTEGVLIYVDTGETLYHRSTSSGGEVCFIPVD